MDKYHAILLKDLPNCPKGRSFNQNTDGDYYLSMTDDEAIYSNLKQYHFTKEEVENNSDWFEIKLIKNKYGL